MTDKDLIGYCELHCRTERALFSGTQINRMLMLAGQPANYVARVDPKYFFVMREDAMMPLVELARKINGVVERLDS